MKINISIDIDDNEIINIIKRSIGNDNDTKSSTDTINISGLINSTKKGKENNIQQTKSNPNKRYDPDHTLVSTFNSIEEVSLFLSDYSHDNNYCNSGNELKLGQRIKINDGVYNVMWYIAGFDIESCRVPSYLGTPYYNGHGIMLIPETDISIDRINMCDTINDGYINSHMNKIVLPGIANSLKNVLGKHLISRNVLLSSIIDNTGEVREMTWSHEYCTLPTIHQLVGKYKTSDANKYDDGEANYKLPLFDHMDYWTGYGFWTRNLYGFCTGNYFESYVTGNGVIAGTIICDLKRVRPLIYIR